MSRTFRCTRVISRKHDYNVHFLLPFKAGVAPPDLVALRGQITALEEEREENQWKVEHYEELKAKSGKKTDPLTLRGEVCGRYDVVFSC